MRKLQDVVGPQDVAAALRLSMAKDLRDPDPESRRDLLDLARWGRGLGLVEPAMAEALGLPKGQPITLKDQAAWIAAEWAPRHGVSLDPGRWADLLEGTEELKQKFLERRAEQLEACGSVWWSQYVVCLFWKDRRGRERLRRQIGVHRCKCAWCPVCGRSRQAQLSARIEKVLTLCRDFGLDEGHARLVTLTSPNGPDVRQLRDEAHKAFGKLQRTRWWNRNVFGFVRGSEVKTGEDGRWNLHIHLIVIFWSDRVSYQQIGQVWNRALASLVGAREDGKQFVVDVEALESKRWNRRDGRPGPLKRKGSLARAARYITKYLTKGEDLANLRRGPGGLAHLELSTRRMRRHSMGGGCSLIWRATKVLMPGQLFQAEELVNGARLHEGRAPWRAELLDPFTGEVRDIPAEAPLKDEHGAGLEAWGRALTSDDVKAPSRWKLPPLVVGRPCGPGGRHRQLGEMPLKGRAVTVGQFEAAWRAWVRRKSGELGPARPVEIRRNRLTVVRVAMRTPARGGIPQAPGAFPIIERRRVPIRVRQAVRAPAVGRMDSLQTGIRALVAEGRWRVFRWSERSQKTGKLLRFACVLPAHRFSWRPVWEAIQAALHQGPWAMLRKRAALQGAAAALSAEDMVRLSHHRTLRTELDDREHFSNGDGVSWTITRRRLKALELWDKFKEAMTRDPRAAWNPDVQRMRTQALEMELPGLLDMESPRLA